MFTGTVMNIIFFFQGNKYRNDQFDIYIENIESESDDPSKYVTDDETDSEESSGTCTSASGTLSIMVLI